MDALNTALYDAIQGTVTFEKLATEALARQLERQGISVTPKLRKQLETQLKKLEDGHVNLTLDLPDELQGKIKLSLQGTDLDAILSERVSKVSELVPEAITTGASLLFQELKKQAPRMHRDQARIRKRFQVNLEKLWGKPIKLLEMLLVICQEVGGEFNSEFREEAAENQDLVFEALTLSHARACQVAAEVLCLLRGGFADGAHARWRTLHEIAIATSFINQHGPSVAEQYLLHVHVEAYRGALQYREHSQRLALEEIEDEEFYQLEATRDELVTRFGRPFGEDYGWAAQALGTNRPSLAAIERSIDMDHWRPYYKLASHNVHPGVTGMKFRLGLLEPSILLAGASNVGLTEAGHATAISLAHVTISLLTSRSNIDRLVTCEVLTRLTDEIGDALCEIHEGQVKQLAEQSPNTAPSTVLTYLRPPTET